MAPTPSEPSPSGSSLKPAALSIAPQLSAPPEGGNTKGRAKARTAFALFALLAGGLALKAFVLDHAHERSAAAEFPLPELEFTAPTPDTSLEALAGSFIFSNCTPTAGDAMSTVLSVEGGQVTEVRRVFQEAGCITELYTVTLKKSINRLTSRADATSEVEYTLNEATLTAHHATRLNEQKFLGQSDWQDGETRDLMGGLSGKLFGAPLHTGEKTYDLLHVDGQRLLARAAGQVALSLPTSLAQSAFLRIN